MNLYDHHRRHLVALIALLLFAWMRIMLGGCAIPVRPVAFVQPHGSGYRFVEDPESEPQWLAPAEGVLGVVAPFLGPVGIGAGALATALAAYQKAKANAAKERAEEHKADAAEGWAKAEEHALARAPVAPGSAQS